MARKLSRRANFRQFWLFACIALAAHGQGGCQSGGAGGPSTEDCADACSKIAVPDCGDVGPECVDVCVRSAQLPADATCRDERATFVDCFWKAESYACDDDGHTTAPSCAEQRSAFERCDSGEGGAGGADGVDESAAAPSGAGGA